jgi:hypothetical protein
MRSSRINARSPFRLAGTTKKSDITNVNCVQLSSVENRTAVRSLDIVDIFLQAQALYLIRVQECSIAEVVRHHNGRVKRAKIKCRNRLVIVTLLGLDDGGPFILFVGAYSIGCLD